jgi:hypothetical protein
VEQTGPAPQLALDYGRQMISAVATVQVGRMPWLRRHGCSEETAAQRAGVLTETLKQAVQEAQRDKEEGIRKSPVRQEAMDRVRDAARAEFHASDLVGALFAWGGRVTPGDGLALTRGSDTAQRRAFTETTQGNWVDSIGSGVGSDLAGNRMKRLQDAAVQAAPVCAVRDSDAEAVVRNAIAQLSAQAPETRVAVLIPTRVFGLNALWARNRQAQATQAMRDLGISDGTLASFLDGCIDGAAILAMYNIRAGLLNGLDEELVMVIDFAHFAELCVDAQAAEPELKWFEPDDPLRPDVDGATGRSNQPAGNPPGPLEVQVTLSLHDAIKVDDPSAARIFRIA